MVALDAQGDEAVAERLNKRGPTWHIDAAGNARCGRLREVTTHKGSIWKNVTT
jgi:hypothetical protein